MTRREGGDREFTPNPKPRDQGGLISATLRISWKKGGETRFRDRYGRVIDRTNSKEGQREKKKFLNQKLVGEEVVVGKGGGEHAFKENYDLQRKTITANRIKTKWGS